MSFSARQPPSGVVTVAGVATAAKQPALGTAGSASADVLSVQGVASGTPVPVAQALAAAITDGTKNVTTAGTRVQMASQANVAYLIITAKAGNTGHIYVGSTDVSSTVYMFDLLAGQSTPPLPIANNSAVWLDSSVNGEGVSFGSL